MDFPIVIITGDQLRHNYFVDQLNFHFDVRGVVSESVYQPKIEGEPDELSDLRRHFEERGQAERRYFVSSEQMTLPQGWLLRVYCFTAGVFQALQAYRNSEHLLSTPAATNRRELAWCCSTRF